ncbi:MAG: hypothetical protein OXG24_01260 [Gammaproteobacteria bacterium]|nr:hypothetical protein [Gammaproteobacteria bacterium]
MIMTVWILATLLVFGYWVWTSNNENPKKTLGYVGLTSLSLLVVVRTIEFFYPLPIM